MTDRRTPNKVILLAASLFAAVFICRPTTTFAAEAATTDSVRPEAAYWQPGFIGESVRLPGDFKNAASYPSGSVAVRDLDHDGASEIIVGSGFGREPSVGIYRGDGSLVRRFAVYDPGMKQGVNVAAGDVDGDGRSELVVGTRPGAVAHVLVLDENGRPKAVAGGFFPFGREFRGGVAVAVGDVDGDGADEVVAAAGPGGEPRVTVWKKPFSAPAADFAAFEKTMVSGVNVATGDVDGDGTAEILAASAGRSEPRIRIFEAASPDVPAAEIQVGADMTAGLNLVSDDLDGDGLAEIVVAPNGAAPGRVSVFDRAGTHRASFLASDISYAGGLLIAIGRPNAAADKSILVMPADRGIIDRSAEPKSIVVSVAEQRLHAYEYGREVKTFLVSTGTRRFPTPLGNFSVLAKRPMVIYNWSYGPGNPDNYDLGPTPWNLLIMPHIYIHYAPWHNNFGQRMSHGCVNVNLTNIKWIYDWAEVGVPVDIRD